MIHNAGIGYRETNRIVTEDALPHLLAVNTVAPYILTELITRPQRLVYMSSILHQDGDPSLKDLVWADRPWSSQHGGHKVSTPRHAYRAWKPLQYAQG